MSQLWPIYADDLQLPDDIESDADNAIEETYGHDPEEDQETQYDSAIAGILSPALDPKALPHSIGISFCVKPKSDRPQIEICATWARYFKQEKGWQRQPDYYLTGIVDINHERQWDVADGVVLQLRTSIEANGDYRISLFLINTTKVDESERAKTNDFLFQPQIRIVCCEGTELQSVRQNFHKDVPHGNIQQIEEEDCM